MKRGGSGAVAPPGIKGATQRDRTPERGAPPVEHAEIYKWNGDCAIPIYIPSFTGMGGIKERAHWQAG